MSRAPTASEAGARVGSSALLALLLSSSSLTARADDKQVCLSSYVAAQTFRQAGKLGAAREALEQCGRASCPGVLRDDCVRWFSEVERETPTLILAVSGPGGEDTANVVVQLDGAPFASRLDGRPLPVDPGPHQLRFELPGLPPVVESVVVRQGERGRVIRASFMLLPPPRDTPAPATPSRFTPAVDGLGVAALASLTVWAGVGLWALYGTPGLESTLPGCRPHCSTSEVSDVRTKLIVADISGGVGVVTLASAAYLFFRGRRAQAPTVGAFEVLPLPGGAVSRWSIRF